MTQSKKTTQNNKDKGDKMIENGVMDFSDTYKASNPSDLNEIFEDILKEYSDGEKFLVQQAIKEIGEEGLNLQPHDIKVKVAMKVISFQREALAQSQKEKQLLEEELENKSSKKRKSHESLQQYAFNLVCNSKDPLEYFKICGFFYIYMMKSHLSDLGVTIVPGSELDSTISTMESKQGNDLRNAIVSVLRVFGGITADSEWDGEMSKIIHAVSTRAIRKESNKPPHVRWLITDAVNALGGEDISNEPENMCDPLNQTPENSNDFKKKEDFPEF
jgi:hypothetical protein